MKFVCLETKKPGDLGRELDREVQIPYLATNIPMATGMQKQRNLGFVGSMCCGRDKRAKSIPERMNLDHGITGQKQNNGLSYASVLNYTATSRLMYEPVGDTPERQSIYQSIASGTPVIFDHFVRPPLRLFGWGGVGFDIADEDNYDLAADPKVVSLLHDYNRTVTNLLQNRDVFLWHTQAFNTRFLQVVVSIFWQGGSASRFL
mmetsp:Transcript_23028/g.58667  ORF Transcript_23028/g.58667 Transcript_23028/m.58667 type:complete len:204 (-) Transcript_23028:272-883(-)|eukprot:CAMPEP_0115870420 /NCGR_PEP_ID=MMETSP0287-20121206/22316_1 /TAXON_ID=412157 /ORGANISM="Chrysochromulina rotalis, Strain UIO044" /LENGTH=203 /DNA_ID=CAMNT_0003325139 /DNA_START=12 /DNA_END=623 /DNA_ORIENTATION=-